MHAREIKPQGMPRNLFRVWTVPCSLISKRVKIPPVLFTRNLFKKSGLEIAIYKPFFKKESFTKETRFFSKGFCEAKKF